MVSSSRDGVRGALAWKLALYVVLYIDCRVVRRPVFAIEHDNYDSQETTRLWH
jgi:hypothetical protein